jgi:membrane protease subunit HflC
MSAKQMWVGLLATVLLIIGSNSIYVIRETERGVLLKFGEVVNPNLMPGLHVKVPFVNNVRVFDGRILTVDSNPERFFHAREKSADC